jgi:hypothetical protein
MARGIVLASKVIAEMSVEREALLLLADKEKIIIGRQLVILSN